MPGSDLAVADKSMLGRGWIEACVPHCTASVSCCLFCAFAQVRALGKEAGELQAIVQGYRDTEQRVRGQGTFDPLAAA